MTDAQVAALERRHDECRTERIAEEKDLWAAYEKLREQVQSIALHRLPVWATVLIATLTGVIGWLMRMQT